LPSIHCWVTPSREQPGLGGRDVESADQRLVGYAGAEERALVGALALRPERLSDLVGLALEVGNLGLESTEAIDRVLGGELEDVDCCVHDDLR
jgi:hypothetical protein